MHLQDLPIIRFFFSFNLPINRLVSKGCKLVGCGSAVPHLQISNDDLAKIVDTNDEWISARTGIRNRRILTGYHFIHPLLDLLFLSYHFFNNLIKDRINHIIQVTKA